MTYKGIAEWLAITLTTVLDTATGTSGNDTFLADNTGANKALSAADQLTGGAGTDILKVYLAAGDTATGEPSHTGIESVFISGGAIVAYTPKSEVTDVTIDSAVVNTAATITLNGQNLTLSNHTATAGTTTTIAAAATATATSQKLTVDTFNGSTHTVALTGTKIKTLDLVTNGAGTTKASSFTLTNAGAVLDTVNVSGSGDVTVTEALTTVKTINASAATGKVAFDVSGATKNIAFKFTGGSGNDTLTVAAGNLAAAALTSGSQIDFGAGTDTLVINDTTPEYATINAMVGLETVKMNVTAGTFNMASLTPANVSFSAVAAGTVSNLASTDTVTAAGNMATSLTVGGAVGNSEGTINIGTSTSAGLTIASLVTTGLTKVNLSSNGTAANTITAMTNSDNTNFVITGSQDLTMAVTSAATVTGDKIDGTNFTGKLTATGSVLADVIIGGSNNDTLTGGAKADTITGGAGADTFRYYTAATAAAADGGQVDKITDFVAGTDKISLQHSGGAGAVLLGVTLDGTGDAVAAMAGVITNATSVASIADVYTQLATYTITGSAANGTGNVAQVYDFTTGAAAGKYLVINDSTANFQGANDIVINVTGLSGTITAADFAFHA